MILVGLGLISLYFFGFLDSVFVSLIYGVPILIIGFIIIFNIKEDKIEEIKRRKK